jgi:RimJ/RimL family protein N-acetyltransferase
MSPSTFPNLISAAEGDLRLEAFSPSNQAELWIAIQRDRENPKRKGSWPGIDDFEALRAYMSSCDTENPRSEEFGYIIRDAEGAGVGTFHIFSVDWEHDCTEVGFGLHSAFEGKGLASKALRLTEHALAEIGFKKTKITCKVWNRRSWAVAERAGYELVRLFHKDQACAGCDECTKVYEKRLARQL